MDVHQDARDAAALPVANDSRRTVKDLAKDCMDLIGQRNELDEAVQLWASSSPVRDRLWHDLEEVMASLTGAVGQLAAKPSEGHAELNHKATVLMTILRRHIAEGMVPGPEVLSLSLSLAEDAHRVACDIAVRLGAV